MTLPLPPLLCLLLSVNVAHADPCVFSKEYIPVQRLNQSPAVDISRWNPASDEIKGVLKSGNLFSIKYWNCNHIGMQALMYIDPQTEVADELNSSINELATLALADSEALRVNDLLQKRRVQLADLPLKLDLGSPSFDEFYVAAAIINNVIVIEIKLTAS